VPFSLKLRPSQPAKMQLSFSVRVSSSIKQVHLLGSWDNYSEHIPLSKDKSSSKTWSGTFRFPSDLVQPGQRYWYYYILNGYHIIHNPQVESTTEPTTGRELNVLDVSPSASSSSSASSGSSRSKSSKSSASSKSSSHHSSSGSSKRHRHRSSLTVDVAKGLPLEPSDIVSPRPISPKTPRHILDAEEEELSSRLAQTGLYDKRGRPRQFEKFRIAGDVPPQGLGVDLDDDEVLYDYYYQTDEYGTAYEVADGIGRRSSAASSNGTGFASNGSSASGSTLSSAGSGSPASSSLSFRSGSSSPVTSNGSSGASSVSGYSTPDSDSFGCTCELYGITRRGERVRIDCGGKVCGYDDSCSSSDDDAGTIGLGVGVASGGGRSGTRRNGVVVQQ
jgi:hypothetical protein